ncbi:MAG: GC-type dockerin domain-anchored protein [Phycisphaerales bacterium]|jgi:hypothetical protein
MKHALQADRWRTPARWIAAFVAMLVAMPLVAQDCEPGYVDGLFCPPGASGLVYEAVTFDDGSGPALYLVGDFLSVGCSDGRYFARWDGATLQSVDNEMNNRPFCAVVHDDGSGPALYVGGSFTTAGGIDTGNIARWDGQTWSAVGEGVRGWVNTLKSLDGPEGPVLYAGGSFTSAGGKPIRNAAAWNGSNWQDVGAEFDRAVYDFEVYDHGEGPVLYAAGWFRTVDGRPIPGIASWDGAAWSQVGDGLDTTNVLDIAIFDDGSGPKLWAGGFIYEAGGEQASHVAIWDGAAWSTPSGTAGPNSLVRGFVPFDDGNGPHMYVTGDFTSVDGIRSFKIARWDGTQWLGVEHGVQSTTPYPHTVVGGVVHDDGQGPALYAYGSFREAGRRWDGDLPGDRPVGAYSIARWKEGQWSALGGGPNDSVVSMVVHGEGADAVVYIGGSFESAGGIASMSVAMWDGQRFVSLDGGVHAGGTVRISRVYDMTMFDAGDGPQLHVAGEFGSASGRETLRVARWDGDQWHPVGEGFDDTVYALEVFDDGSGPTLFAGGEFDRSGAEFLGPLARWDGAAWRRTEGSINRRVFDLLAAEDGRGPALFVGGDFDRVDGRVARRIARWDGTSWDTMQTGVDERLFALAATDIGGQPVVVASGFFQEAGGVATRYVASWDGAGWSDMGVPDGSVVPYDFAELDRGDGRRLYASANDGRLLAWDGIAWEIAGEAPRISVGAMAGIQTGPHAGLYFGGTLDSVASLQISNMAYQRLCPADCRADLDGDGVLTIFDFLAFQNLFQDGDLAADFDGDGSLTIFDFLAFQNAFAAGCP